MLPRTFRKDNFYTNQSKAPSYCFGMFNEDIIHNNRSENEAYNNIWCINSLQFIYSNNQMRNNQALLALIVCLSFVCITEAVQITIKYNNEPKTVPYVDIQKYKGLWYEQYVIPFYFERGCINTMADYELRSDGNIQVNNTCTRNGKTVNSIGKAIPEDDTNAKLKVEFIQTLDIGAQYWIVRLDKDYTYAVISSPNYRYLWILCREKHMNPVTLSALMEDLKLDGFPVDKLQKTEQN